MKSTRRTIPVRSDEETRPAGARGGWQGPIASMGIRWVCLVGMTSWIGAGCSTIKRAAIREAGDALSGGGSALASDDDPEFVRLAAPSNLKIIEALLQEVPEHEGLLLAATSGFTQYAYAFLQQDGDRLEGEDIEAAWKAWRRARAMFLRARGYGLQGLEVAREGFEAEVRSDPGRAVAGLGPGQVPLLYWTACAWGGAISLGKDDPNLIADIPQVEALIDRAYGLDPDYGQGAIHQFLIAFEGLRVDAAGDPVERSRYHFDRAVALSGGGLASPFVSYAESVSVKRQDREEFQDLLGQALAIDVDQRPEWRLVNLIMQERARWLLARVDDLILPLHIPATLEEEKP